MRRLSLRLVYPIIEPLKLLQWNCRSIFSASTDLSCLIVEKNPDIILLQETWLGPDQHYHLKNYRSFRLDRRSRGGGLLTLISNRFCHKAQIAFQLLSSEHEILVIALSIPSCRTFYIANVYYPAGVNDTNPLDSVICVSGNNVLLAGDFNSHHITWGFRTDSCGTRLWDWSQGNSLICHNSGIPTFIRGTAASSLDLNFSGSGLCISSWTTVDSATNSDHIPVIFKIICPVISVISRRLTFINYSTFKKSLRCSMASLSEATSKQKALSICSVLQESRRKAEFEVHSVEQKSMSRWWNDDCTRDYRRRKAAWKKLLHNQCPKNWSDYKFIAGTFKRTVAKAKMEYDEKHFEFLSKSNNKRALFGFLRHKKLIPQSVNIESIILSPQELTQSLESIAKGLEKRFAAKVQAPPSVLKSGDSFTEISMEELSEVIRKLPAAAPGPDGVTSAMLKILFKESREDVLNIINYSIKESWIPTEWKIAKIIPVLKKPGEGYVLDNIRPIALTSNFVKLIERALLIRIVKFVDGEMILRPCQIGLRQGCSIWQAHIDLERRGDKDSMQL